MGLKVKFHSSGNDAVDGTLAMGCFGFLIAAVAAWCTHVVWIIKALASSQGATAGQMVLGALGAFMPPIGVVHGVIIWFS